MKRAFVFAKRNITEMGRDPLCYVFCLAFPVVMLGLFFIIAQFAEGINTFDPASLLPGMVMFAFSFVMLMTALLIANDRSKAFLVRLYSSPMRSWEFVAGYAAPSAMIGIAQEIVCLIAGWGLTLMTGGEYFSFLSAVLLALEMLPMLFFFVFAGLFFGCTFNEKAAPGVASVIISVCGILGGAWMPLDSMGGFETVCRFLPFYPSVYIGRVITGAYHSVTDFTNPVAQKYVFDSVAALGLIPIAVFLAVSVTAAVVAFNATRKRG